MNNDRINTTTTKLREIFGEPRVLRNEPLARHTYMKIGGPAEIFFEAKSRQELVQAYQTACKNQTNTFVLGGGSNIVVSDSGINGLVIKNRADKIRLMNFQGGIKEKTVQLQSAIIEAQSGAITNQLVRFSIDQGLAGLEYFLGVPGTVGGAVYNNSHYQDQLIGNSIKDVTIIDAHGEQQVLTNDQLNFSYDYSVLQDHQALIVSARFALAGANKSTLWQKATSYAKNRTQTQPLSQPSSGCMFKNITSQQAKKAGFSLHTSSAGYLIDQLGLKGTRIGDIVISPKHANFMVNLGEGKSRDVIKLVKLVKKEVKSKYNISLKPEVFFVGNE